MKTPLLRSLAAAGLVAALAPAADARQIPEGPDPIYGPVAPEAPKGTVFASPSASGRRGGEVPFRPPRPEPSAARGGLGVDHGRGELRLAETDLVLPGRGFDLRWVRTYRSHPPRPLVTPQGNGWDHSYNLYLEADGPDLVLHEGVGRADRFRPGPGGVWVRDGDFHTLSQNPDGSYTATWPHGEQWLFAKLDGAPAEGRVTSILDRVGNTMAFAYDGAGRLQTITDTVGRTVTVAHNAGGRVASVSANGNTWVYAYYGPGDPDGNPGDLKSVRTPIVSGTPNGNDYPSGKTTTYTYSKHPTVPELAHNLLKVIAPSGDVRLENRYATTTDPGKLTFDRIRTQKLGQEGGEFQFTYFDASTGAPGGAGKTRRSLPRVLVIVNDPRGVVSHILYDERHLPIRDDVYTGFADPALPTTRTTNRPTGALRPGDPERFRTSYRYDGDDLLIRVKHPEGDVDEFVHESALTPGAPRQARGLLREWRRTPGPRAAAQAMLVQTWEHHPGFQYVTRVTDPGGKVTEHHYDTSGNRVQTRLAVPGLVHDWTYDASGQPLTHVWPDDGTGYRRTDAFAYHGAGPQLGMLATSTRDAVIGGLNLERAYTWTVAGLLANVEDEQGNDWTLVRNQLGQVVRWLGPAVSSQGGVRYVCDYWWNRDDELSQVDVENRDESGALEPNPQLTTTYEYDSLHHLTRVTGEVDALVDVVTEYEYDAGGLLELVRSDRAVKMTEPDAVVSCLHDERGLLYRVTRAPAAPEASTTELDYDGNGNVVELRTGIEDGVRTTRCSFDGYDRPIWRLDAMGNRVLASYDANSRLVERELLGERDDVPGSAGNVSLSHTVLTRDELGRILTETRDHEDGAGAPIGPGLSVSSVTWAGVAGPATTTDPSSNVTTYTWDRVGRLGGVTDAAGNTFSLAYDATDDLVGRIEMHAHDLGGPPTPYAWTWLTDELGRFGTSIDPGGETRNFAHDSRGNVRTVTGPRGNLTHFEYDGRGRLTRLVQDLTDTGTGMGTKIGERVHVYQWQQGCRGEALPTSVTDDTGYMTTCGYDALDRLVQVDVPDGTSWMQTWDAHDDLSGWTDASATVVAIARDALGREMLRTVAPGPGVSNDTLAVTIRHDGAGRPVCLDDDDTSLAIVYDSLGAVLEEQATVQASGGPLMGTVAFTRNAAGDATRVVLPGLRTLDYAYDPLHRVETVSEGMSTLVSEFRVGPRARPERRTHANGTQIDWTYDAARRPTRTLTTAGLATVADRTTKWIASSWELSHVAPTSHANALAGGSSFTHELDSLGRLRESVETPPSGPMVTISYALNDEGDRMSVSGGPSPGSYVLDPTLPDPGDAQVHQYTETPFDTRTYDASGNLVARDPSGPTPPDALVYDYAGQLIESTDSAGVVTRYAYDALGRRVRRVLDATGTPDETLVFHVGGQQGEEVDGTGATQATYVPMVVSRRSTAGTGRRLGPPRSGIGLVVVVPGVGPRRGSIEWSSDADDLSDTGDLDGDGRLVAAMRRGGVDHTFHPTPDGSIAGATDALGSLEERYEYGDFGEPRLYDDGGTPMAQSLIDNPYLYRGAPWDGETRTYYVGGIAGDLVAGSRNFEPAVGRFLQRGAASSGSRPVGGGSLILIPGFTGTTVGDLGGDLRASSAPNSLGSGPARSTGMENQLFDNGYPGVSSAPYSRGPGPARSTGMANQLFDDGYPGVSSAPYSRGPGPARSTGMENQLFDNGYPGVSSAPYSRGPGPARSTGMANQLFDNGYPGVSSAPYSRGPGPARSTGMANQLFDNGYPGASSAPYSLAPAASGPGGGVLDSLILIPGFGGTTVDDLGI